MHILFLRHPMYNVGGTGVFTMEVIRWLRDKGHVVGLWPSDNSVYEAELQTLGVHGFPLKTEKVVGTWDIVVLQHVFVFEYGGKLLQGLREVPHVFISHASGGENQIVPYASLYRVVTVAESLVSTYQKWGIPEEMVEVVYNPVRASIRPRPSGKAPYRLVHVSRLYPDRFEVVRQIIMAVNPLKDCTLTIVGGGIPFLLECCANSNVTFAGEQLDPAPYYIDADLVIGSGRTAVEALALGRPVVVAGARGWGGLVTPDNYQNFTQRMFAGRDGGTLYEKMPPEVIRESIYKTMHCKNLQEIVEKNFELVQRDYNIDGVCRKLWRVLEGGITLHRQLSTLETCIQLKPKLASNLAWRRLRPRLKSDVVRLPLEKKLMRINRHTMKVLQRFDGTVSVAEVFEEMGRAYAYDLQTFAQRVKEFWAAKILVF